MAASVEARVVAARAALPERLGWALQILTLAVKLAQELVSNLGYTERAERTITVGQECHIEQVFARLAAFVLDISLADRCSSFPGLWLYGAYVYDYPRNYTYHNSTTNKNETHPVKCACAQYVECGCNQVGDGQTKYINNIANNASMAVRSNVNGVEVLFINGTLPNGTTAASSATGIRQGLVEMSGWWVVIAGVVYTAWFL